MESKKLKYAPPVLVRQKKMRFPLDIIEANGKRVVCKQCSSCHSCR
jgi:hypothetical protein